MQPFILHQGRAQDVLPGQYEGLVDLVVTSPPYDGMRDYAGVGSDAWDFEAVAAAIVPCLRPGGVLVWVVADQIVDGGETGTSFRHALHFRSLGLRLHQTLLYYRHSLAGMSKSRYYRDFEYMFVFSNGKPAVANLLVDQRSLVPGHRVTKKPAGRTGDKVTYNNTKVTEVEEFRRRGSVWQYYTGKAAGNRGGDLHHTKITAGHPAYFPQDLASDHIRTWTEPGAVVLDPMAGSGTVLRSAVNLGRRAVGVEVVPQYCDLIRRRLSQGVLL